MSSRPLPLIEEIIDRATKASLQSSLEEVGGSLQLRLESLSPTFDTMPTHLWEREIDPSDPFDFITGFIAGRATKSQQGVSISWNAGSADLPRLLSYHGVETTDMGQGQLLVRQPRGSNIFQRFLDSADGERRQLSQQIGAMPTLPRRTRVTRTPILDDDAVGLVMQILAQRPMILEEIETAYRVAGGVGNVRVTLGRMCRHDFEGTDQPRKHHPGWLMKAAGTARTIYWIPSRHSQLSLVTVAIAHHSRAITLETREDRKLLVESIEGCLGFQLETEWIWFFDHLAKFAGGSQFGFLARHGRWNWTQFRETAPEKIIDSMSPALIRPGPAEEAPELTAAFLSGFFEGLGLIEDGFATIDQRVTEDQAGLLHRLLAEGWWGTGNLGQVQAGQHALGQLQLRYDVADLIRSGGAATEDPESYQRGMKQANARPSSPVTPAPSTKQETCSGCGSEVMTVAGLRECPTMHCEQPTSKVHSPAQIRPESQSADEACPDCGRDILIVDGFRLCPTMDCERGRPTPENRPPVQNRPEPNHNEGQCPGCGRDVLTIGGVRVCPTMDCHEL